MNEAATAGLAPVLVLVDVQREYVSPGRGYWIEGIQPSLENIAKLLAHGRASGWEIVHIFHHQEGGELFVPGTPYALPIEGFEPADGEKSIVKADYSCFTSPDFGHLASKWKGRRVWIVGYGSTACCLATLLHAYNSGNKFSFVHDASAAVATHEFPAEDMHAHTASLLRRFVDRFASTAEILAEGNSVA